MFEEYNDRVIFLLVYVREAHPASASLTADTAGWKVIKDKDGKEVVYHQPKTYKERQELAKTACDHWEMPIPSLVDTLEPSMGNVYQSLPNRIYLIGKDGKVKYQARKGPMGAVAREAEIALREHFGVTEGEFVTKSRDAKFLLSRELLRTGGEKEPVDKKPTEGNQRIRR